MKRLLIQLIAILPVINCWSPIVTHPASYSVQHSYPSLGSETEILKKSSNELFSHDTSVDHLFESFHAKSNDYHVESPVSALKLNDGRFLSAKALHFSSNSFNGNFYDVSNFLVMLSKLYFRIIIIYLSILYYFFSIHSFLMLLTSLIHSFAMCS